MPNKPAEEHEDLNVDNLTPHVIKINSTGKNERANFIFQKLIQYSHDFIRDVDLKTGEWEAAWQYLTDVGKTCTQDRQEMILLSDVLGISALVDSINNAESRKATESSVLGPFHNEALDFQNGESISSIDIIGEPMLIRGTLRDINGAVISDGVVDVWETNGNGFYDMQDPDRDGPDCRGKFRTDSEGRFFLNGVRCVDYPIPDDGPVGVLVRLLNRTIIRPAHVHFMISHPSYKTLVTALYSRASPFIAKDPVFGVKTSLIKDFTWSEDESLTKTYGIRTFERIVDGKSSRGCWVLEHDFVLVPKKEE